MSTAKKFEAGDEINSRCLKCKDVTNHVIIAMVEEKVAKVICNVCKGRHNYRPEKPEKTAGAKKKAPRGAASAEAKAAKTEARYVELLAKRDPAKAVAYAMTGIFKRDDLLDHPVFGLGLITKTIRPDKIEVEFRMGSKLLICGPVER
ncbi:MAG: hypothetical protein ABR523_05995 [Desulfurivibrionaceae bacterium]